MASLHEIKNAVSLLSREQLSEFRSWYKGFDDEIWDELFNVWLDDLLSESDAPKPPQWLERQPEDDPPRWLLDNIESGPPDPPADEPELEPAAEEPYDLGANCDFDPMDDNEVDFNYLPPLPKALAGVKARIRELTRRTTSVSEAARMLLSAAAHVARTAKPDPTTEAIRILMDAQHSVTIPEPAELTEDDIPF